MGTISQLLTEVHRELDERYTEAENAAGRDDMDACAAHFAVFRALMDEHLALEEELLFPAFERTARSHGGPTQAMAAEHGRIREMMRELAAAADAAEAGRFIEIGETMALFLNQHSTREENVLYPLLDEALGEDAQILERTLRHGETPALPPAQDAGVVLDLRGLEPPEPMERVLTGLSSLPAGERLMMIIDREPRPLFRILERNGYAYSSTFRPPGTFEILIWQRA